jgi:predicted Zn-dependent peptidase
MMPFRMIMDYQVHKFENDIRLVHKQVKNTRVIHCGYTIDIGSRDENIDQLGIAHFWEHMAFKGTNKRKAYHIISRLDSVGGELNAFTTKEKVFFYSSVLSEHLHCLLFYLSGEASGKRANCNTR